ncbi:DlpA domain-containing protein [Nannizzia gypsea CBS 118893]|uniref:DlpA domain-containing protein n=1 Tax=Arthroderma gypseum (strain ATCC MYA-4604 / CBS 118893) TaxID=535722 RepID=E4V1C8_ARTGP|nr:DlpA domain-containing protein [Nannizzia gypsea CBS 118893]EFR03843.1 DlpA domain-containing protein [Nannizzia gypsea CBS 118893]
MVKTDDEIFSALQEYSACDLSDALLKLEKVPKGAIKYAGFIADVEPFSPSRDAENLPKIIGYASTIKFVSKDDPLPAYSENETHGFPPGTHWVDNTDPNTIVLLDQPPGQKCAILGGIMASRMKVRGAKGAMVNGRVRDLAELRSLGFPVWARGTSTVGTGAEAKAAFRNVPICIDGVTVNPGDILFCDPLEGVVVIPSGLVGDVLELMSNLVPADDKVKADVLNGSTVFEAFKKHRGS